MDRSGKVSEKAEQALAARTASGPLDSGLLAQHQVFLAAATADNTRRAYRSAIRHYLAWGGVLPAQEGDVVRYLLAYAGSLNPRTLALRLTALAQWHRQQGFADPTASVTVRKTLAGIGRVHGVPAKKARPLELADLERIVAWLEQEGSLKARRDNALLQVGFFGGFRRSEVVGLQVEHLAWERQGLVITLARSKTDQRGEGIAKAIPYGEGAVCPATALRRWLADAGIREGALFRAVTRWNAVGTGALHAASVNAILAERARQSGLDHVPELSSHSLRRGMATSAHRAGASFRDIKRQGGWRHDGTVQGYIEEASQFTDNAAAALLRRKAT